MGCSSKCLLALASLLRGLTDVSAVPVDNNRHLNNFVINNETQDFAFGPPFPQHTYLSGSIKARQHLHTHDVVGQDEEPVETMNATLVARGGAVYTFISGDEPRRFNVINATPYRWRRAIIHSYQIPDWNDAWPKSIESGQVVEVLTNKASNGGSRKDTGAEVIYELDGTCKPMAFKLAFNPTRAQDPDVRVTFFDQLKTRWTRKGGVINLGQRIAYGGVNFLLAGTEDNFYSNEGPLGWMQEQLGDIGKYPLNQIVMPRSHHAGMVEGRQGVGLAHDKTTLTQTRSPYVQIATGGVRVLDFRPYERSKGTFSEGHFSSIAGLHHGMIGIGLGEIIDDINRFNRETPGELIILDFHDAESWVGKAKGPVDAGKFRPLEEEDRARLWKALEKLEHRFSLPHGAQNVHEMPLESFIGTGRSAVLIHVPDPWTSDNAYPGGPGGYVSNRNFPRTAYWSATSKPAVLVSEQASTLRSKKGGRGGKIHDAQWILRLGSIDYVTPVQSLNELAQAAWGRLYSAVWRMVDGRVYPSWISFDAVETEEGKALAMAMNRCLVAGKCGKLGGKAPNAQPLELKCQIKEKSF
ncbi:LysM domain-containing protein [Sarocladium implicatum]|nr:LysM domain-containing protein [Sarocladium implicatum]